MSIEMDMPRQASPTWRERVEKEGVGKKGAWKEVGGRG